MPTPDRLGRVLLAAAVALAAVAFAAPQTSSDKAATRPAPKATPRPAPVLEGIVKGPDGKPIEGARVFYRDAAAGQGPAPSLRTDAEGRFRASLKSAQALPVRVEAKGFAARSFERVQPGSPLVVILDRGRTIEGLVRDAAGQPVARAQVVAKAEAPLGPSLWDAEANRLEATTNARGRYQLEGVGAGLYTLIARASGRGAARRPNVRAGSTVDLVLQPKASLGGIVQDGDGRPLAGALVRAEPDTFPGGGSDLGKTDANGQFELLGLEAGSYAVIARHPDFAPSVVSGVALEAAGHAETTLVLTPGFTVTGRVLGPGERPLAGEAVVQELSGHSAPRSLGELLRGEAGQDGRFRIERVPAGAFVLGVTARRFAGQRVEGAARGGESLVDVGDILLEPGLAIRGRLRMREGVPVAEAALHAFQGGMMRGGTPSQTRSEADGSFTLPGLSLGPYQLRVTAPGFAPLQTTVAAGAEGVDLVLERGGAITGVVVEEGDRPVDAYRITANPAKPESQFSGETVKTVGSPDGRFVLEDLSTGDYVLQILAPDRAPATARGTVVAQRATDVGVIRLGRGGIIRGSVVEASGGPIVGATVRVQGPGYDPMQWMQLLTAETDPAGAFEIRGVPEGPKHVVATHPEYAGAAAQVEVVMARGPADARLVLTEGGRVEGSARRRDGTPLSGLRVHAMSRSGGPTSWGVAPPQTITGPDGRFALEHVRPGPTTINLMSAAGSGRPVSMSVQSKTVEVRDGETVSVDFLSREILVTGRVTQSGAPLAGIRIQLMGESMSFMSSAAIGMGVAAPPTGPQRLQGTTGEDGAFELIVDEPGKYRARIESQDGRRQYPMRSLEIPDVEAHSVELSFSGVPVSGIVVDKETQQPAPQVGVSIFPKKATKREEGGAIRAMTGPDGRFELEADPGESRLFAHGEGYTQAQSEVTVDASGTSGLRVELERGLEIRGRIVDLRGRGLSGIDVFASSDDKGMGMGRTLADGTFRVGGLAPTTYNLCTGDPLAGYAVQAGVRPGDSDVALTVRPAGTVRLVVKGPDGAPLAKAHAFVTKVDGGRVQVPFAGGRGPTDSSGVTQLSSPAGSVEIQVSAEKLSGTTQAVVGEGATVDVEVTLKEPTRRP